jgi:tellurite resistance protein TehA-like permease
LCMLMAVGVGQLAIFFLKPSMAQAFFFVFFLTTLIRAPTEVFLGPFSIQTLLLFACAVYSVKGLREAATLVQHNASMGEVIASAQPQR